MGLIRPICPIIPIIPIIPCSRTRGPFKNLRLNLVKRNVVKTKNHNFLSSMTPEEKNLISGLFDRLSQAGNEPKDLEADQLIRSKVGENPGAPFLLACPANLSSIRC